MDMEFQIINLDGVVLWQGDYDLIGYNFYLFCKKYPTESFRVEKVQ